jgi:putative glutamine amidotransferase
MPAKPPVIGITTDVIVHNDVPRAASPLAYVDAVVRAGGTPVLLPPFLELVDRHAALCDAFVFTGGDDPRTEDFGVPTHPAATTMDPRRQAYEVALLRILHARPAAPALGVCLGMQMMALVAGGQLEQHLPDVLPSAPDHRGKLHPVMPEPGAATSLLPRPGSVDSRHHQAVRTPGRGQRVIARSHDGVIEAIDDPSRRFFVGVQWHPERTADPALGQALFDALVAAARQ